MSGPDDIAVSIDAATRVATFTVQRKLLLPIKVDLPFALLKGVVGNIIVIECNQERQGMAARAATDVDAAAKGAADAARIAGTIHNVTENEQ